MNDPELGRRSFLTRIGLLGLAGSGLGGALSTAAPAAAVPRALDLHVLRDVLGRLSSDTFNGLGAFVVPGPDPYSTAQGTPSTTPGALAAEAPRFVMESLDNFVPFPDATARSVTAALATGLSGSGVDLPGLSLLPWQVVELDQALGRLLRSDETVPLSVPVAGLLNLLATRVNPASVTGTFLSPFARLSFAEKARVFELIETADSDLVATLDAHFPEPLHDSVSGALKFVGGALLEFTAFGTFSEFGVLDPATDRLAAEPVGWRLTGHRNQAEGWDSFRGYYQGRTAVEADA